jgi:hypothetical protein
MEEVVLVCGSELKSFLMAKRFEAGGQGDG